MNLDLSNSGSQSDLAELVGVSQPAISQLMTAGKIPPAGTLGELVRAYVRHMQQQADIRQGSGLLDLVQERAALARTQREGYEIKNTALLSEYAPTPLLKDVLHVVSDNVTASLDQMERTLPARFPGLPADALRVVRDVIASARGEWIRSTSELACRQPATEDDDAGPDGFKTEG